jgi:hypothetical protein
MKGGDYELFGEEVGNLIVLVSHSGKPIDAIFKEGDAVGLNNFRFQNHLKKH